MGINSGIMELFTGPFRDVGFLFVFFLAGKLRCVFYYGILGSYILMYVFGGEGRLVEYFWVLECYLTHALVEFLVLYTILVQF